MAETCGCGGSSTDKTIKGTVYATQALADNGCDYEAIEIMTDYLEYVFDFHGYSYQVYRMHGDYAQLNEQDVECSTKYGALNAFNEWSGNAPREEKDFNLCITNLARGDGDDGSVGCAGTGGNLAVIEGGPDLVWAHGETPQRYTSTDKPHKVIRAGIHEVGHNLGVSHDYGHASVSDTAEEYRMSPMYQDCPENACGYSIPCKPSGYTEKYENTFCACALENFSIV